VLLNLSGILCITLNKVLFKSLWAYFIFALFPIGMVRPITYYIFKFTLDTILTALGIALNETLSTLTYFKSFSEFILSLINPFLFVEPIINLPSNDSTGSWFTIIGTCLLGADILILALCVADSFTATHDTIRNLPGISTILDLIYSLYHTIHDYLFGFSNPGSGGSADPISISNSGSSTASAGSNITITDARTSRPYNFTNLPTLDISRPVTPLMLPTDSHVDGGAADSNNWDLNNPFSS
jgi:hypothetical protein